MKAKALQFGKAISAALFVLLLVVVGSKNALAQTQVATLQHGDDISVFYGMNAFVEAHTVAADGDIITLSSGTFTKTDITKAITLRGAGCMTDSIAATLPTIIPGDFSINSENDSIFFSCEGIYFSGNVKYSSLQSPTFIRCNFEYFGYYGNGNMYNAQFVNCKFRTIAVFYYASNLTFINCVLWQANFGGCTVVANNSIVRLTDGVTNFTSINCIVNGYNKMYPSSIAYNTMAISNVFYQIPTFNCMTVNSWDEVFETFTGGSFSFEEEFVLKDEIATGFLGTDGTEVGIHGGFMPYDPHPTYMVLKRCNVAPRSTIDGKLSVDIEVIGEGD